MAIEAGYDALASSIMDDIYIYTAVKGDFND